MSIEDTLSRAYAAIATGRGYAFDGPPRNHSVSCVSCDIITFRFYFGGQARDGARACAAAEDALRGYSSALASEGLVVIGGRTHHDSLGWYAEFRIRSDGAASAAIDDVAHALEAARTARESIMADRDSGRATIKGWEESAARAGQAYVPHELEARRDAVATAAAQALQRAILALEDVLAVRRMGDQAEASEFTA